MADALKVTPLSGSLGAEIRGIDLAKAGRAEADAILAQIAEHLVLFFPDQHLTPDEHIAFGRLFGKLEGHPNLAMDAERPEFFELRAESGAGAVADEWHSDLTCQAEPSVYAILHMKKCPPVGGDTLSIESDDPDELVAALRTKFGGEPKRFDDVVRLEHADGHRLVAQIVEAFPGRIKAITLGKPTLEDVFIARTGHRFLSEEPSAANASEGRTKRRRVAS